MLINFRGLLLLVILQALIVAEGNAFSFDELLNSMKFNPSALTVNTLRNFLEEVAPADVKIYTDKLSRIRNQCSLLETKFQKKKASLATKPISTGSMSVSFYTRDQYIEKFSKKDYENVLKMVNQLENRASRLNAEIESFLKVYNDDKSNGVDLKDVVAGLPGKTSHFIRLSYNDLVTESGWPNFTYPILMSSSSKLLKSKILPEIQLLKNDIEDKKFDECQLRITDFLGPNK